VRGTDGCGQLRLQAHSGSVFRVVLT
jgi:hypothetical protein